MSDKNNQGFAHDQNAKQHEHDGFGKYIPESEPSILYTGFDSVDKITGGFRKGDLVFVSGRPGMGTSAFALNIAVSVAKLTRKKVCIFSPGAPAETLYRQILSIEGEIGIYNMRTGELSETDTERLTLASDRLSNCEINIYDTVSITVSEMIQILRDIDNIGLVIVDGLKYIRSGKQSEKAGQRFHEVSAGLKSIAEMLNLPVICCTELTRRSESRADKRPRFSDMRYYAEIKDSVDTVILIYRDCYYCCNENNNANTAEIIVDKNAHGQPGKAVLSWCGYCSKFTEKKIR